MEVIGHRGACGYVPQNTLQSFELALALGIDKIELDVHVLPSGEVVVIHDYRVDATTDGEGLVTDFEFEELRQLDAGDGQKIPLLSEVLDLVDGQAQVNVELKGWNTARPVAELLGRYTAGQNWNNDHFLVTSTKLSELAIFNGLMPEIRSGAVFSGKPSHLLAYAAEYHMFSASLGSEHITPNLVRKAHKLGLLILAFTVNDTLEAERMVKLGVDGVFSNYPDHIRQHISQMIIESEEGRSRKSKRDNATASRLVHQ